jgi:hypothetical protein
MPASASFLSDAKYGYDIVVATTQMSINSIMLNFLAARQEPTVNVCYIADQQGVPTDIDYKQLKKNAQGIDPFALPNNLDSILKDFQNLFKARFMVGFRMTLGIPKVSDPTKVPDVVILGSDTSAV